MPIQFPSTVNFLPAGTYTVGTIVFDAAFSLLNTFEVYLQNVIDDFLDSTTQRSVAIERAVRQWQQLGANRTRRNDTQLLIAPTGVIRQDVVDQLRKQRDDTLMYVPE